MSVAYKLIVDPPYPERSGEFLFPYDRIPFRVMATAIARIYVPSGFTVAADGRELSIETGSVSSDSTQKIFGLHHRRGNLACAVTGAGRIGESYKLSKEIPKIAATLEDCEAFNVGEYAERIGNELKRSIDKRFSWIKNSLTIQLLLDGFIDNQPGRAKVTIRCGPFPAPVGVESQELFSGMSIGFGSGIIHRSLFAPILQHEPLRPYWAICRQEMRTLDQSTAVAHAVIAAQCDPYVAILDPAHCASIGGHIHIAEITPERFSWRKPPV